MLTFRRALFGAAFFFMTILLITSSHSGTSSNTYYEQSHNSSAAEPPSSNVNNREADSRKILQDMSRASLQQKLEYHYPYHLETKFPAYIWQTWKFTPASGEFKESYRPAEASWTELHPSFIHEVISDQVAIYLLRHLYANLPEVVEAYISLPLDILKADFFRYLILFARGGIYSDIDTYAIKSAVEWLPESVPREAIGMVIGLKSELNNENLVSFSPRQIQFCQWTIQAKAGHPVLREIVANITQATLQRRIDGSLSKFDLNTIDEFTGSILWTDIILKYFNDERYFDMNTSNGNFVRDDFSGITSPKKVGDIVILPKTSFNPDNNQLGDGGLSDPLAFVKHEFAGT